MAKKLYIFVLGVTILFAGCHYGRITVSINVQDYGDKVSTKYHYRVLSKENDLYGTFQREKLHNYQPNVFSDDGTPIVITNKILSNEAPGTLSRMVSFLTIGIFPFCESIHSHRRCIISLGSKELTSFDICTYKDESFSTIPFLASLVYVNDEKSCFPFMKKLHFKDSSLSPPLYFKDEICEEAMAYGIAVKLREAEESGLIDDLAAEARVRLAMSDILSTMQKIIDDDAARRGVQVSVDKNKQGSLFEITRCEVEQGKDFSYVFALRRKGGEGITFADNSVVHSVFRSAIRTHYASLHPDINPRTLEIDFTDYTMKAGSVSGRVTVLSISPESLSYDSHRREGVIRVRLRDGQFEDARRWVTRNIGKLARKSNIDLIGDVVPKEGRFFSEREEMKDGVLEVSFTIE